MKVAFLWHMHQPSYIDSQGRFFMPWVFLHAIKDYYDMPQLASEYGMRATFNLTPILMVQLQKYIDEGWRKDLFLRTWMKEPSKLSNTEREELVKICKSPPFETMVAPFPRYAELHRKSSYTDQELLDLAIYFLLSWCGRTLRKSELIQNMMQKSSFSQKDKEALLHHLFAFLPKILPLYKKLQQKGLIEVSTTPYTHPIMPLLLDMRNAKRANPSTTLPKGFITLEEDAILHIQRAIELYEEHFETPPRGFWPAEGAVDEKSLGLYEEAGLSWAATDEEVLKKSGGADPYGRYEFEGLSLFFRDHTLSDLIGFHYKHLPPKEAAEDFFTRLKPHPFTAVILDGENPWEYYPGNGVAFLEDLYANLKDHSCTFSEALALESRPLAHIEPGSWIWANFDTWVGDEEKNRAWELLYQTKRDTRHHTLTPTITEHFLHAEASDWFWWYGKGHYSPFVKEFDTLFRDHLIAIYRELSLPIPTDLLVPIVGSHSIHSLYNAPQNPIDVVVDGYVTSFFEWLGSGYIDERIQGSMQNTPIVTKVYWGENDELFFLRLDYTQGTFDIHLFIDDEPFERYTFAKARILELSIEKSRLPKHFEIRIEIVQQGKIVQIVPSFTRLFVELDVDYSTNWFI